MSRRQWDGPECKTLEKVLDKEHRCGCHKGISNECVREGDDSSKEGTKDRVWGTVALRGWSEDEDQTGHPRSNCLFPGSGLGEGIRNQVRSDALSPVPPPSSPSHPPHLHP